MVMRRIAMTLQRWFELECGDGNNHGSWAIVRGHKNKDTFDHDDDGKPYLEHHHYLHGKGKDYVTYSPLVDRETGARKRLAKIISQYPELWGYVQTDPRGASVYVGRYNPATKGSDPHLFYTSGIAVFK